MWIFLMKICMLYVNFEMQGTPTVVMLSMDSVQYLIFSVKYIHFNASTSSILA